MGRRTLTKRALLCAWIAAAVLSCSQGSDNSSIVIPPGQELSFSTEEFLKYSDANFEMKIRSVTGNTTLADVSDLTATSTSYAANKTTSFRFIVPKTVSVKGLAVVDIVSKSTSLNWKAIILDPTQEIRPTVETTLLYDLLSKYDAIDMRSYNIEDLKELQKYIDRFSVERQDLFGVTGTLKASEIYRFVRNGLSSDLVFLGMLDKMGMHFDVDAFGRVLSAPYPFGLKNNAPIIDDARTTPLGTVGAFETVRVDVRLEARDPDGDRLFYYFQYLEDGSIFKDAKIWTWTPSYFDSRPTPYRLRAFVSDGSMEPILLNWDIIVSDNNRPPRMSGTCPTEVTEGETWVCDLYADDPDEDDKTRFSLVGITFPNAVPKMNGVTWVPGTLYETRHLRIEWTPSNRDFVKAKPLNTFQIVVSDYTSSGSKKNGDDVRILNLSMKGKNKTPYPVTGPAGLINWNTPLNDPPRVLDVNFLPGTPYDADTRTADKKFFFEIVLVDDDNDPISDSSQHDISLLRVNTGADLIRAEPDDTSNMTKEIRNIAGVNRPVTVFRYSWQPTAVNSSVVASFTPTDDMQSGQGQDFNVFLSAEPRTELPVCTSTPSSDITLNSVSSTATFSVSCPERPMPTIATMTFASVSDAAKILPFLRTTTGSKLLAFTRKVGNPNFAISEQNYGPILAFNFFYASQAAGVVRFQRTGLCDAAHMPSTTITIPTGTKLVTTYNEAPYQPRINYQTADTFTLGLSDCEILIPVTTVSRSASAGQLSVIYPNTPAMIAQGLTAQNTSTVNYETAPTATITFSRASSASALTIPAGTMVRTNEPGGAESIAYVVPSNTVMPIGVSSLAVTTARDYNSPTSAIPDKTQTYYDFSSGRLETRVPASPASGLTWKTAPIPGLSVSNPIPVYPRSGYDISVYKNLPALQKSRCC
ncbi:MAG: hypothetical protein HC902_10855 [Calothrix sp. SM1_5_4]|nr:hypothetical protein [Calothrix sp. SM1_5_4]